MYARIDRHLGFVGAGNMAEALIAGLVAGGSVGPERIWVVNRSDRARLQRVVGTYGVRPAVDKAELCERADVVVLAVKPKDVPEAVDQLKPHIRFSHRVLSVVAGLTIASLEASFPRVGVVRAMPNTPSAVREGIAAFALGSCCTRDDAVWTQAILTSVGRAIEVPEQLLDAVTGLSGSGPAYVFFLVESMIEAGVRAGLSPDVARDLVIQTVFGAARMLRETGADPAELRRRVTSPGGTTMAGLGALEERDVRGAVVEAVRRAAHRARELAK
ncbi:MAG: pyrroline-5-carboxylate reductase [Armatimonadota bacterium]|nr:pyrroline-5-carboxylate reductase [Armatimonadota bacterium]MDR5696412.1 pyrroline-5-carboxylate reductase [Armatimonadota bacterium]